MWYPLIRQLLFALPAEFSHDLTLAVLKNLAQMGFLPQARWPLGTPIECFGLQFAHPVGLAAGLDKNGECIPAWEALGFAFIEVGTVTPRPQAGNPQPRLFRLSADHALINRMGFNNKGVDYLIEKVSKVKRTCPLGINIGKNKDTTLALAYQDYWHCFQKVYAYADYVTINISSPNTPGLRDLQHEEQLSAILSPLIEGRKKLADQFHKRVPILVKLAPDLSEQELHRVIDQLLFLELDGVIATNTSVQRMPTLRGKHRAEVGGLSGEPLHEMATKTIQTIYQQAGDALPIIAVGGTMSAQHAKEKLTAGAKLLQLYTGFIYQGPRLIEEIVQQYAHL